MLLELKNITKVFSIERGIFKQEAGIVRALDDVSFSVEQYKTVGIVGE